MTNSFANNPPKFDPSGGLPAWSRAASPSAIPVQENQRSFELSDAMRRGDLRPDTPNVSAPSPFPARSPAVPGSPKHPVGI